jgi:uncharacterized membrane protein YfcA
VKRVPRRSQSLFSAQSFACREPFQQSFYVLGQNRVFLLTIATASIVGTFIGGRLLGILPANVLVPLLAMVLLISAVRVWRPQ